MTRATTTSPRRRIATLEKRISTAATTNADAPARAPEPVRYFVAGTPTSVNHHYRVGRGHVYLNPSARAWEGDVWAHTCQHAASIQAIGAPLALTCRFIGGRADVDNLLKAVLDGFKQATGIDDHWITRLTVIRERRGKRTAGVWITVESANEYTEKEATA